MAAYAYHVLHPTGSALEDRDPVIRAALAHVARHGPARPGEQVDIARFFAGRRAFQRDQYAVLAGSVSSLVEWVSRPLAWTFVVVVDDDYWGPYFDYLAFSRLFEVDVGGVTRVAYGNDWRRFPMDTWLDLMNEREHAGGGGPRRPPCCGRRRWMARFAAAVRAALADLHRPDRLAASPLMGSSLAAGPGGPPPTSSARPSRRPSPASGASPRATRSGRCCSAPLSAAPPPRRPPPRCSACPSAPTGATWPGPSSSSPTCCGRWRSARSAAAATGRRLSSN